MNQTYYSKANDGRATFWQGSIVNFNSLTDLAFTGPPHPYLVRRRTVQVCAVSCRVCCRRAAVAPGPSALLPPPLPPPLAHRGPQREILPGLLTGGDPLGLSARRLRDIVG